VVGAKSEVRRYNSHMSKHYDQYCPIAHAVGMLGERWTLLVVRELLYGPKRYTDLVDGLPGIGTNVLASRLRDLEESGVVQKRKLAPPAACTVYELTEYGQQLDEVVYSLARWGVRTLGPPAPEDDLDPEWGVHALPALFNPEAARGLTETYVLKVGDDVFTARLEDGELTAELGEAADADLRLEADMDTFFGLASGDLAPGDAVAQGLAEIEGDLSALERFFAIFSFAPRRALAPVA
jgi:DNA-binding HxlR family transcriptional regulator/putative sterol carrier protein